MAGVDSANTAGDSHTTSVFGVWRRRRAVKRLAGANTPEAVRVLADAIVSSEDERVLTTAEKALTELTDQASIDVLCDLVIDTGDERLAYLADTAGFQHSNPARRALMLFLAGDFDAYAELDFDGATLRSAHAVADDGLRRRLAERAGTAGRVEWVRAVIHSPAMLSDREWDAVISISVANGQFEELWRLVTEAPAQWGVRILRILDREGWRPGGEMERARLDELITLARSTPPELADGFVPADLTVLSDDADVKRLAVTPDGRMLCASVPGAVRLWALPSGEFLGEIPGGQDAAQHLAITSDSELLVGDNTRPSYIPDGHLWREDGQLGVWRLPSREPVNVLAGERNRITCLALTPDGELAVAGDDHGRVHLWYLLSGQVLRRPAVSEVPVECLAVTPDSRFLVCGDVDGRISLVDLSSGMTIDQLHDRHRLLTKMVISPDGRYLYTLGSSSIWLWDLGSRRKIGTVVEDHGAFDMAITPDGQLLTVAAPGGGIRLLRLPSAEPAGVLSAEGPRTESMTGVVVVPGEELVTGYGWSDTLPLLHLRSGEHVGDLIGGPDWITQVAATGDGQLIAAADSGQTIRLWRLWRPEVRETGRRPVGTLDRAVIEQLRQSARDGLAGERAWLDLIASLLR